MTLKHDSEVLRLTSVVKWPIVDKITRTQAVVCYINTIHLKYRMECSEAMCNGVQYEIWSSEDVSEEMKIKDRNPSAMIASWKLP